MPFLRLAVLAILMLCSTALPRAAGVEGTPLTANDLDAGRPLDLRSRWRPGDVFRVDAKFEVGGQLILEEKNQPKQIPMSVVAHLRYDERLLPASGDETTRDEGAGSGGPRLRALRHYDTAEATIKIAKSGKQPTLPDDSRQLVAELAGGAVTIASPNRSIRRETLDLVAIPGSSIALDRLLPEKELRIGDTWKHDPQAIQALVGIDSVAVCEVESVLVGVEREFAKIKLAGSVQGAIDGVATEIELRASYLFDTKLGRITRFNFAMKEKRGAGPIGSGVDVVAKLSLVMDRVAAAESGVGTTASTPPASELVLPLAHVHGPTGMRFMHGREWFVTSEQRERIILRHVAGGELTAQCQIAILPQLPDGQMMTVDQFEKDVRFALGTRLDQIVAAHQWRTETGLHCIRIAATGKIEELPIEWRYYLLVNDDGRRVAATITVEGSLVERLNNAEREIIESLTLPPENVRPTEQAARVPQ